MTNDWVRFGRPEAFEVRVCWVADAEPPERRPVGHGWSMGRINLIVAGENLTASVLQGQRQSYVGWYLSPVLDWIATHWVELLHEERFAWSERTRLPAAVACRRALEHWIAAGDPIGREAYRCVHAWYHRHGLRSAALGGIFPDLFIRRSGDDIELSWTAEPPPFAPEGLTFESTAGRVRLAVADLAEPLWGLLQWATNQPPEMPDAYRSNWAGLCAKVEDIERLDTVVFERAHVPGAVLDSARIEFGRIDRLDLFEGRRNADYPFIEEFSPAVAMFGGASPELGLMISRRCVMHWWVDVPARTVRSWARLSRVGKASLSTYRIWTASGLLPRFSKSSTNLLATTSSMCGPYAHVSASRSRTSSSKPIRYEASRSREKGSLRRS